MALGAAIQAGRSGGFLRAGGRARRWGAGTAAAAAALAAWAALARNGGAAPDVATVHREDLVLTVEAAGELEAVRSSDIGPPSIPNTWQYKIASMAPESFVVKKGDVILAFDVGDLETELQRRQVEHEVAVKDLEKKDADLAIELHDLELRLAEAESNLRKATLKSEVPEDLGGGLDLKLARLDLALARKEVESLHRRLEGRRQAGEADREALAGKRDRAAQRTAELKDSIARMTIRAPQDGIIVYVTAWNGSKKKIGDPVWLNEKVLKIPDLTEMMAKAEVDEADAGRLAVGQPAVARLDALPDAEFTGRLKSIARVVQRKSQKSLEKVYKVELSLDLTDPERMRPGMRARSEIEVERASGALVVPREAVFVRPGGPVVHVRRSGSFVETPVRLGRRNARLVEILEGASEGDLVARHDLGREEERAAGPMGGGPGS